MEKETNKGKQTRYKDSMALVSEEYDFVTFHYNDDELGDRI